MIIVGKSAMEHGINNHIDDLIICVSGSSREGQNIADIRHAGHIEYKPLEAQSEPRMPCAAVSAKLQIPVIIVLAKFKPLQRLLEHLGTLHALASSEYLPDSGYKKVHGGNRLPVVILTHIKSLYVAGIIGYKNGAFEMLLGQIAFMLGLQIAAP